MMQCTIVEESASECMSTHSCECPTASELILSCCCAHKTHAGLLYVPPEGSLVAIISVPIITMSTAYISAESIIKSGRTELFGTGRRDSALARLQLRAESVSSRRTISSSTRSRKLHTSSLPDKRFSRALWLRMKTSTRIDTPQSWNPVMWILTGYFAMKYGAV